MRINLKIIFRPICWLEGFKQTTKTGIYDYIRTGWKNTGHQFGREKNKEDVGIYDDWTCEVCGYVSKGRK